MQGRGLDEEAVLLTLQLLRLALLRLLHQLQLQLLVVLALRLQRRLLTREARRQRLNLVLSPVDPVAQ